MTETPAARTSVWDDTENAARYAAFTREFPMYARTSADLVRRAGLTPDGTVIDLACGTGETTRQILAALGPAGRVTSVDRSAAMLAIAATSVQDDRVTWVRAPAEEFDQSVEAPASAVICNSAIWQTAFERTTAAARRVLGTGGTFVFNIGIDFVAGAGLAEIRHDRPGIVAVMREIAGADYDWSPPAGGAAAPRRRYLSQEEVEQVLRDAGFEIGRLDWLSYQTSPESQRAWLRVPAFTDRLLPGLPYEARMAVLDKAYQQLGPGETAESRWLTIAAIAA